MRPEERSSSAATSPELVLGKELARVRPSAQRRRVVLFVSTAALRRHLSLCDVAQKERRGKVMEPAHRLTRESSCSDEI